MKQHQIARIASAIHYHHPELFARYEQGFKAQLDDVTLIPGMFEYYQSTRPAPRNDDDLFNFRLLFVASILDLYDPGSLYFHAITAKSLTTILARVLGFNNRQSVGKIKSQAMLYIKNKRFKDTVKRLSEELKKGCVN